MTTVYVGVGSNVEQEKHSRAAIDELNEYDPNLRVSPIYSCAPVGFEGAYFYNFVIELNIKKTLTEFSHALRNIEIKWGRVEGAQKYQDRKLDLDILLFGNEISVDSPIVPRDDIFKYPFVIQPLYDLAPDLVVPDDGRRVREIWQEMDNLESLSKLNFL
jgi:2-amino-4-hydroxy-6-hydroxymethyldihydropteridine diphosphokinase